MEESALAALANPADLRGISDDEVAAAFRAGGFSLSQEEILACLDDDERKSHAQATARIDALKKEAEAAAANTAVSYVGVRVEPVPTALLQRGSVTSPGEIVSPSGLSAITTVAADLGLPPDAPEAERRKRFAVWIADRANPLPARVIANRIWQYHFGRRIDKTVEVRENIMYTHKDRENEEYNKKTGACLNVGQEPISNNTDTTPFHNPLGATE
jgi:hypothetical protein